MSSPQLARQRRVLDRLGLIDSRKQKVEPRKSDGIIPRIPEIWQWTDGSTKQLLLYLFEEMDRTAFRRWSTGLERPDEGFWDSPNMKPLRWTKSDGGRYEQMQDQSWKEYDADDKEIRSLECMISDLPRGMATLLDREEGKLMIIKGTECALSTCINSIEDVSHETGVWNSFEEKYWNY